MAKTDKFKKYREQLQRDIDKHYHRINNGIFDSLKSLCNENLTKCDFSSSTSSSASQIIAQLALLDSISLIKLPHYQLILADIAIYRSLNVLCLSNDIQERNKNLHILNSKSSRIETYSSKEINKTIQNEIKKNKSNHRSGMKEKLEEYIKTRKSEKNYHSFWGWFKKMDKTIKIQAAEKMLNSLNENSPTLSLKELKALKEGRLGKIVSLKFSK